MVKNMNLHMQIQKTLSSKKCTVDISYKNGKNQQQRILKDIKKKLTHYLQRSTSKIKNTVCHQKQQTSKGSEVTYLNF